jgi:iron complex outermembrane recepter protein
MPVSIVRSAGSTTRVASVMRGVAALLAVPGTPAVGAEELATPRGLEEIIVTARKREESLQDTPISVTALTADALEARNIETTKALGDFTPNLVSNNGSSVSGNNSAASYFIRGIGQIDFLLNTDPGVGLYLDEVYIARSMGSVLDLVDVERVEILRGPQGTLFGRNTIGGAIAIRSRPPAEKPAFQGEIVAGSDDLIGGKVVVDLPLSDTLLTQVAASYDSRDGYVHRIEDGIDLGDIDGGSARAALRWLPGDAWRVDLAVDGSRHREESPPTTATALNGASAFGGFYNAVLSGSLNCVPPPGSTADPACFNEQFVTGSLDSTHATFHSQSDLDAWGAAVTAAREADDGPAFKSITAYRSVEALGFRDGDNSPHVIAQTKDTWDHEQLSQELQLAGTAASDVVDWIVGLYYFEEQGTNLNFVDFAPVFIQSGGSVDNDSWAAFGQATWRFAERWSLTGGLRYTDETKRFTPDQFVIADRGTGLPPGTPLLPSVEAETSISELTPMVNLAFRWSDDAMTYVTYSEGFKSGGFTQRVFPPLPAVPSFDPEFARSYEIGTKLTAFDDRLRLNGAAFFTDYEDLQVQVLLGVAPITQNAAAAEIQGFELELTARPTAALLLEAGVGYTDAEYTEIGAQVIGLTLDKEFAQIPEWTINAGASYDFALPTGGVLRPRVNWSYHSATFMDALNTPEIRQSAYDLVSASLSYTTPGERWQATLSGTNLTDERYFTSGFADLPVSGIAEVVVARPREWALSVRYRF